MRGMLILQLPMLGAGTLNPEPTLCLQPPGNWAPALLCQAVASTSPCVYVLTS